ncbi:penicillin acylase family protein [Segetibacter sp. 3557_3]|uniref:penicillin acylase family protein n=1 Tax=Segetibacter sp. 3557_3 TaxID=2547429 RepID=UPI001058B937|nr:penicillin acylase family protein [Segetibacter sp. 3557_3]TDH28023.1 penicillin acylase family protein [Segetibacter sp. 3557_3]
MKWIAFLVSLMLTTGLIIVLNVPLPAGGNKTPRIGAFLSPQHGCWQNAEPLDADFNADLRLAGISGKVTVSFDERLVPHVNAANDRDAYFVQGYLHAKFRLWQMEFQTHAAAGRLSEIMGAKSGGTDFVQIDKYFRRLGMVSAAEASLIEMEKNPVTKAESDAYTAGVNAYISALSPNKFPLEYKLLGYHPEPWTNLKSVLFLKYMSFDLAGGENDFEMTNAKSLFSVKEIEQLYPVVADSLDPVIPKGTVFSNPGLSLKVPVGADSAYYNERDTAAVAVNIKPDRDNGSNNWAVAGSRTVSGKPILCNDPHLGLNLPSLWYEMQITTPSYNAYGATFPGSPSVIIGFNDSCAWGFTNAQRDVRDYYEIRFRDTTRKEYWFNGSWHKAGNRREVIRVKGQPDIIENIALTLFGPVMYDPTYSNKLNNGKSYAVRWKAHDPGNELLTFNKLEHAKVYNDFVEAISTYKCPGQNMLFAAKNGNIAIVQQGEFPAKWRRQGDFVMPGNDSAYMWQGNIPMNENPMMENPARGFLSSANQLPVDGSYPYYLGGSFTPYRGIIINRRLGNMVNVTADSMKQLQTDNYNIFAEMVRPVLLKYLDVAKLQTGEAAYVNQLKNWNLRNDIDETGPTIFKVWWDNLESTLFNDEFARANLPLKWPDNSAVLEGIIRDSLYHFADDIRTPVREDLKIAVHRALTKSTMQLDSLRTAGKLSWGKYKSTAVRHLLRIPALGRYSLPIGGGVHIINATKPYHGPSWRMIVHLTNEIEAYGVYPGGQSGNPGSRYYDSFIDTWAAGKYYKLLFIPRGTASKNVGQLRWTMTFSKA